MGRERFFTLTPSKEVSHVYDLRKADSVRELLSIYSGAHPRVFVNVVSHVQRLGAQLAVAEHRYLDADYRNEHSRFYSTTFRRYPSVAHRIHFFRKPPPDNLFPDDRPARFGHLGYLGYCVVRPVPGGPVGRTLLTATPADLTHISCRTKEKVNLFGDDLTVEDASPFIAQDAQFGRCAHATVWVTAYYHHLQYGGRRVLPGDIADSIPTNLGIERLVPSSGLTLMQLAEAFGQLGLPCIQYRVEDLASVGESVPTVVCRYLNSGIPVTVAAGRHAFVLVGYEAKGSPDNPRYAFLRQDDEIGPYQRVEDWRADLYKPWRSLIVPLPPKVYVAGEQAEIVAREQLVKSANAAGTSDCAELVRHLASREVSVRSTLQPSNDFKRELESRGATAELAACYSRMSMSRWIWVVEATLRNERSASTTAPCVVSEAVIDATDHLRDPHVLAWRIPGYFFSWSPDENEVGSRSLKPVPPLQSVSRASFTVTP